MQDLSFVSDSTDEAEIEFLELSLEQANSYIEELEKEVKRLRGLLLV